MGGGGRRRRTSKRKTMKGGNFYGVGAAIAPGAIEYNAVANAGARPDGTILAGDADLAAPKVGGRRRGKKVTRKSRKSRGRRRTMRGGASSYNVAGAGWGFGGHGIAGGITPEPYASRAGGAPMNADGVRSA